MDNEILVTVNSDNMTVSNTDVIQEFKHLTKIFGLTKEEVKALLLNSINGAFISSNLKQEKIKALFNKIDSFYDTIKS